MFFNNTLRAEIGLLDLKSNLEKNFFGRLEVGRLELLEAGLEVLPEGLVRSGLRAQVGEWSVGLAVSVMVALFSKVFFGLRGDRDARHRRRHHGSDDGLVVEVHGEWLDRSGLSRLQFNLFLGHALLLEPDPFIGPPKIALGDVDLGYLFESLVVEVGIGFELDVLSVVGKDPDSLSGDVHFEDLALADAEDECLLSAALVGLILEGEYLPGAGPFLEFDVGSDRDDHGSDLHTVIDVVALEALNLVG